MEWVGLMDFDFGFPGLELSFQYLLFKGFPLFLGENTGVVLLSYFHSLIGDLDHRAARTCIA